MKEIKLPFLVRLTFVLISILAVGYLAVIGKTILAPLFFSFLMALLLLPFAKFLETRLKFRRALSTFSSVLVMGVVLTAILYFFASQLSDFTKDFPVLQKQVTKSLLELQVWISKTFHLNISNQWKYINQGLEKLLSSTGIILGFTVAMFSSSLAFVIFSILFFIFILNYRRLLYHFIVAVFTEKHTMKVHEVMAEIQRIIKSYISGLFIQILIVSVLTIGLLTLLDVKYAILIGVLTGLMNLIPYIGIFVSCLLACLISFATGGTATLFVLIGYVGIHVIDGNIILPLVVGSKVKINALFTFIGLLVGEAIWGISGMFLSIPFLAILKIIFERVEGLQPWGKVLGEETRIRKPRRKYKITKNITLHEKE
ncbi:AI-2E family transporter [Chryseobacterium koreense]|uniref:Permease n=1 Tax=Chryseobacterium koreense CCUG 49689 TaxID=1304281 RepID=A0A0J7J1Q0_9FLAO|nr:AI-2E family transporter [Chryseobacterium koreense]KMQ71986.1 permease [Chryseobacterium koreense CCUG 49689]MBB5332146.1 putative PurR-regulated permease PerM [Chryseobacterium koreense]